MSKKRQGNGDTGAKEAIELVDLEVLEPTADPDEVPEGVNSAPEQDSPGDDAVLEQEELYEGISSEGLPSDRKKQL